MKNIIILYFEKQTNKNSYNSSNFFIWFACFFVKLPNKHEEFNYKRPLEVSKLLIWKWKHFLGNKWLVNMCGILCWGAWSCVCIYFCLWVGELLLVFAFLVRPEVGGKGGGGLPQINWLSWIHLEFYVLNKKICSALTSVSQLEMVKVLFTDGIKCKAEAEVNFQKGW